MRARAEKALAMTPLGELVEVIDAPGKCNVCPERTALIRDCDGYVSMRHVESLRPLNPHTRALLALPVGS